MYNTRTRGLNMKKLSGIANQIRNHTYSYTGKGAFEAIANSFHTEIIDWLENLIPLQKQISFLEEKTGTLFQKRNYTRILTKLFPAEYKEFVSINILVRDANVIAKYYKNEFNTTILHAKLIEDNYLKYPGKYQKYVEFEYFQKFTMMYRDEMLMGLEVQDDTQKRHKKTISSNNVENKKAESSNDADWLDLLAGK